MILIICCICFLCYAGLVGLVYFKEIHVPEPSDYDSIIVLGAQVLPTGEPSVQLRWRLDKAIEMYERRPSLVVTCGARGDDEPVEEGKIMRELLIADGLPEDRVIAEISSQDTKENIMHAWEILLSRGCERPLIVTSDYHLPRALAIATDAGLTPQGAGGRCQPWAGTWLKNHMREALSWVKYWGIKHLGLPL
ncbi:MAG: YdcF family protein [Clostridia bacterium]|nr:YdcF family protein [Clostridia bacterium]